MTDEEAQVFVEYQRNRDMFLAMLNNGVFDTKNGSIVLHFNFEGRLMKIDRNQILFMLAHK